MMARQQLRKLLPSYRAMVGKEDESVTLIPKYIASTKQNLSKFDLFQVLTTFRRLGESDGLLVQAADAFFKICGQPYLSEVVDTETFASVKDKKEYSKVISTAITRGNLRNKSSVKLAESLAQNHFKASQDPEIRL